MTKRKRKLHPSHPFNLRIVCYNILVCEKFSLREGVKKYGVGKWREIKTDPDFAAVVSKLELDVACSEVTSWLHYSICTY